MDPKIIDGRKLAVLRQEKLVEKIKTLSKAPKVVSILVGEDAPSVLYTNIKQKKATEVGIDFEAARFSENAEFSEVETKIKDLNNERDVDGIMVQLPLPEEFLRGKDEKELLQLINPQKDVDGLNYAHQTTSGEARFIPAAAKAVMSILEEENIEISGKKVVVVGASDLVGKPVAEELKKMGGKVTICNSKTVSLQGQTLEANILVSATGVPGLITGDMVKNGVIVIDVGAEKVDGKLVGDVDFASVYPKASRITPVPGGVGPMTVISLMENVVEAVYNSK